MNLGLHVQGTTDNLAEFGVGLRSSGRFFDGIE